LPPPFASNPFFRFGNGQPNNSGNGMRMVRAISPPDAISCGQRGRKSKHYFIFLENTIIVSHVENERCNAARKFITPLHRISGFDVIEGSGWKWSSSTLAAVPIECRTNDFASSAGNEL
jgi:hypothetical protein